MSNSIVIVQGGLWGSESKGAVALFLCERDGVRWVVRTGAINAGHSIIRDGIKKVYQQLPVGAVLPDVNVVLGPGAYIHRGTIRGEIIQAGCQDRIYIDERCGVHLDEYAQESKESGRTLKIGATGKGAAEAIIHRIKDRNVGESLLFTTRYPEFAFNNECKVVDTSLLLNDAYDRGEKILLEGTQGTLLDLYHGPYPFTTSRSTIASAWVTEAGLSPALNYEVVLVVRTYPIRVAGNSGPMSNEIDWPTLARRMNARFTGHDLKPLVRESTIKAFEMFLFSASKQYETDAERKLYAATDAIKAMTEDDRAELLKLFETTTVTKRLRRIAELDVEQLKVTVRKERPAYLVVTFVNYVFGELWGKTEIHDEARAWLGSLQDQVGCEIRYTSTGPESKHFVECRL